MSDVAIEPKGGPSAPIIRALRAEPVWLTSAAILLAVTLLAPSQGFESAEFTLKNLVVVAPYLVASIALAAYAKASGADGLIAHAFKGSPLAMIALAALAGGLSPFCSCGVIPLIAALLAMGVPLSAVMAFWLASPVMDPSMFALTAGVVGAEFALAKTAAAIGLGLFGGFAVHAIARSGGLTDALRPGVGDGGCGGAKVRRPKTVAWRFWREDDGVAAFRKEAVSTTLFLAKWLALAFILESLMLAYVPQEWVATALGGSGVVPVLTATLVGVPAYLNGYAALPLVGGLMEQGMSPGAGLAFLVAGGVTSLPAAIAVWALVRPPVFALYAGLALAGSLAAGLAYHAFTLL